MNEEDPKPAIIPNASTLTNAKYEYKESAHLDKDPVIAISKLKKVGEAQQMVAVRNIGYDPFFVIYFTNYQSLVYRKYALAEHSCEDLCPNS